MRILLDTHVIIWVMSSKDLLSQKAIKTIQDFKNKIYISPVSIAEISIKVSKNKLRIPDNYVNVLWDIGYEELSLQSSHALLLSNLPIHHFDPFDRLLICQAIQEDIFIMTSDRVFSRYDVSLVAAR